MASGSFLISNNASLTTQDVGARHASPRHETGIARAATFVANRASHAAPLQVVHMHAPDCTWGQPPTQPIALHSEVHLWRASLDQKAERVAEMAQSLSEDESVRAGRFHFERDRTRFIVGRGLLRAILGSYIGAPSASVQFSYGLNGKPTLTDAPKQKALRFNLAHAEGLALYAVTLNREIGVDLENIHPIPDAASIAEQFFSSQERDALAALPGDRQRAAFFRLWTRKEAYLKAVGKGLEQPLNQIQVSLHPSEPARILRVGDDPHEAARWSLQEVTPAEGYIAALAVEGSGWSLRCWSA